MKAAQGLIEYVLVFVFATIVLYMFASKIDLSKVKSFAIYGLRENSSSSKIVIPPMTK